MLGTGTNNKLKIYLSKKIFIQLIPDRKISGILRGFDQFLNLVLEESYEFEKEEKKFVGTLLIRGNMIISIGVF